MQEKKKKEGGLEKSKQHIMTVFSLLIPFYLVYQYIITEMNTVVWVIYAYRTYPECKNMLLAPHLKKMIQIQNNR